MKPHKHAELIKAWADGAEIQAKLEDGSWGDSLNPCWFYHSEYRIKPEPKTAEQQSGYSRLEWAEDLIKQLPETHDGRNSWLLNYGTKPEPKPDVVWDLYCRIYMKDNGNGTYEFIKAEKLKSAEVLK